ncbi:Dual specificity protein phosphatase 9 [Zancudomyces culisetae]|uniref:protein-tyrosine-phosphatase n=1 Tax=Zancudomyces culisetae TaxID=1213189 RepID=A0A1R1PRB9_ZANCU|nr:Dual specificity protein phosphatase 9 [Zancudomyces culisetae]|eukprot:OMH83498.1 Dual specificity protein phosphatase 9 [Zancudomyces culisetae]
MKKRGPPSILTINTVGDAKKYQYDANKSTCNGGFGFQNNYNDYNNNEMWCEFKEEKAIDEEEGPVEIVDSIYLGSERDAANPKTLRHLGIERILSVAKESTTNYNYNDYKEISPTLICSHDELETPDYSEDTDSEYGQEHGDSFKNFDTYNRIEYMSIFWDHNEDCIKKSFEQCFDFINQAVDNRKNVLIHCQLGVSRSATLVIAYVMYSRGYSFNEAYQYVKARAPRISPNFSLLSQLMEYEKERLEYAF